MGDLNKLMVENQELKRLVEELTKERNKFRSQAMMRQHAKEQLQDEVALLKQQLEQAYE